MAPLLNYKQYFKVAYRRVRNMEDYIMSNERAIQMLKDASAIVTTVRDYMMYENKRNWQALDLLLIAGDLFKDFPADDETLNGFSDEELEEVAEYQNKYIKAVTDIVYMLED